MRGPLPALAGVLSSAAALGLALALVRLGGNRKENHAGRLVPVVLGRALLGGIGVAAAVAIVRGPDLASDRITPTALAALAALYLVGEWDDHSRGSARGFRGHLGGLRRGRITTGVVKLAAGAAAAFAVALAAGGGGLRVAAATLAIAASTNLWNALDVRPGRALKAGLLALVPLLARAWGVPYSFLAAGAVGSALALVAFDLRERGMLGDAGSNPLGFLVGAGLAVVLSTAWLVAASAVMLALTLAAETVTISRLIDAVPPLRWLDRLGRRLG